MPLAAVLLCSRTSVTSVGAAKENAVGQSFAFGKVEFGVISPRLTDAPPPVTRRAAILGMLFASTSTHEPLLF